VARVSVHVDSPFGFFEQGDDRDKKSADKILAGGLVFGAIFFGLLFSFIEHSLPLRKFKKEALDLASGKSEQLHPSKFRGAYRKIAAELNEGIDKVAASTSGQSRRATNLEDVLGELPAQPQMAAFAVPGGDSPTAKAPPSSVGGSSGSLPQAPGKGGLPMPPSRAGLPPPPGSQKAPSPEEIEAEWRQVFELFVKTKRECGEVTEGFTYEKFRGTLVKNRDALIARSREGGEGCSQGISCEGMNQRGAWAELVPIAI
jgi:hypothetical protein